LKEEGFAVANTNAPFGFRQVQGLGAAPTYEQVEVVVQYNAAAIYFGDPVAALADGTVAVAPTTTGTPPPPLAGIFQGCKYLSVSQKRTVWSNYWPGSDVASGNLVTAYIINDPHAKFIAQTDGTGAALIDVNSTVGFNIGTGNPANGISGAYLIPATAPSIAGNPFTIFGIVQAPPGANGTLANGQPYDWAIVGFNNVQTKIVTGI
jgi:hypothetical protein